MSEFASQSLDVVRLEISAILDTIIMRRRNSPMTDLLGYQKEIEPEEKIYTISKSLVFLFD